ncbi:MAG: PP2C family protein-serine/threonine phosphatase [Acidobacteriota bacterium]
MGRVVRGAGRGESVSSLRRRVRRLAAVAEASTVVHSTLDLKVVADYVVGIATRLIRAERGSLFLVDRSRGVLTSLVAQGVEGDRIELGIGEGIVGTVAATGDAIIIAEPYRDLRFDPTVDLATGFRTRSLLTVPVRDRDGELVAVLQLLNHRGRGFSREDVAFLAELGVPFAIALATAGMHREIVAQERAREELRVAADIQRTLLPQDFSGIAGLDVVVHFRPSFEVGGDYYDLIPTQRGTAWLVVADISGKGVAAGLVASNVQSFLWSRKADPRPLDAIVGDGNELLHHLTRGRKYATLVIAEWEETSRTLSWVNAGHPPILLRQDGRIRRLGATGGPIGLLPGLVYTTESVRLNAGDLFLLCTDGVLEAGVEADLEEFGMERTEACMIGVGSPAQLVDEVSAAVDDYLGAHRPHDDITLLAARCLA